MSDLRIPRLVLLRHGPRPQRLPSIPNADLPLLPEAAAVLAQTAERLKARGLSPDRCIVSPALRTRESARILLEQLGATITVDIDDRLHERDLGPLENLSLNAYIEAHPEQAALLKSQGIARYRPPGGENIEDIIARTTSFLRDLSRDAQTIFIVTHEAVIKAFVAVLRETPIATAAYAYTRASYPTGSFLIVTGTEIEGPIRADDPH